MPLYLDKQPPGELTDADAGATTPDCLDAPTAERGWTVRFVALALIWGISFIDIAVTGLGPLQSRSDAACSARSPSVAS